MGDVGIPNWLKGLPLAPEYRPTDTEFADPIAYISKIEKEASAFGICKVIPPLPKPSKKYVLSNLNKSLSKYSELDSDVIGPAGSSASQVGSGNKENDGEVRAVFTTRHQELGQNAKRPKVPQLAVHKQVWQSGEAYTLEQFEVKSKAFARSQLGMIKEISPLVIEALFWKAASEKPIYVEYANDVPGSGFGEPQEPFRYFRRRKRRRKFSQNGLISLNRDILADPCDAPRKELPLKDDKNPDGETSKLSPCSSYSVSDEGARLSGQKSSDAGDDREGTAGWKLSNSPWNLQVIARSPGSLTRFMPDEIPGVTSPMVYIGMLFSWFAWHVEDHELHSLNYLHVGSPKTWYAVPGDYAFAFEEVVRAQAYGGHVDRLAALALLGEKTTLLSPEVVVSSGIPCCRLVQNPGEFVVTFPRAYHVGFGHGFSCGEAANFGTPQWLKVAKEAAVRRAAMDYLPMLSHQQLLYMLTMSFISRVPRSLLPGARSSRLRDRQKEERELLVKKAFIDDMLKENSILSILLGNESTFHAVLWDPDSLPSPSKEPQLFSTSTSPDASCLLIEKTKMEISSSERETCGLENVLHNGTDNFATMSRGNMSNFDSWKDDSHCYLVDQASLCMETVGDLYADGDDLPCGLQVDSGTLACVACGVLGFPFMSVIQPSVKASRELFPECLLVQEGLGNLRAVKHHTSPDVSATVEAYSSGLQEEQNGIENEKLPSTCKRPIPTTDALIPMVDVPFIANGIEESASSASNLSWKETETMGRREIKTNSLHNAVRESSSVEPNHAVPHAADGLTSVPNVSLVPEDPLTDNDDQWIPSNGFLRPRVFCLEHAVEIKELLQLKGGANVLVICHTDYEKIKAHAVAVAEEIGNNPFRYRDIPLQSASSEDLNLINVSIDDEREESGEDWTSKLGLNLRYCVKVRKISSKQEQHALTLGGLFSDIIAGSNASSLKWHRKRSRTHHKLTEANQLRLCNNPQINGDDMFAKGSDGSNVRTENKIIQYSRRNFNNAAAGPAGERRARGRPRKHLSKEIAVVNDVELNNRARESEDTPCTIEMVGSISAGLAPSAVPGKQQEIQKTEENLGMTLVSDGGQSNGSLSTAMISVENFEALVENQIGDKADTKSKICNFMTVDSSEMLHEIHSADGVGIVDEAFDVTNTAGSVSNSVESLGRCKVQTENQTVKEPNTVVEDFSFMDLNDSHQETSEVSDHANLTGSDAIEIPIVGSPELNSIVEENTMEDEKRGCNTLDNESKQKFHGTHGFSEVAPVSGPIDQPTLMEEFCEVPQEVPGTNDMDIGGEICSSHINAELENACHTTIQSKGTSREGVKGKREVAHVMEGQYSYNGFIKSPCEGLRPRTQRIPASHGGIEGNGTMGKKLATKNVKRPTDGLVPCKENNIKRVYRCDLEGCCMSFKTRAELVIHKRNQCPHEACGKQFSSHRYAMLHQKVHDDDRPLKCPWKGCKMSFKWAWARTEHQRVHTGERPYRCKVTGCGLTFRFVSDFSRHRRKTGHYVNVTTS